MALAPAHSCRLFRAFSLFPPLEKIQTDAQPRRIYRIAFVRHDLVYFPIGRNQFPLRDSQYKERSAAARGLLVQQSGSAAKKRRIYSICNRRKARFRKNGNCDFRI